jgi:hypothetical protein
VVETVPVSLDPWEAHQGTITQHTKNVYLKITSRSKI